MEFEWDDAKAAANLRDHGVSFAKAAAACGDPFAVEWIDDRHQYGEKRVNLLGMCEGVILHVTYTERAESALRPLKRFGTLCGWYGCRGV